MDRVGERLRASTATAQDIEELEAYRRSFAAAYEHVISTLRRFNLEPSGRSKSTVSIADKLVRERIRLTQIQDIAGCRVTVGSLSEQDAVVAQLRLELNEVKVDDRRERPSSGYRAVQVIVALEDRQVEIQVRTLLQHSWAQLSEKAADLVDPAIKYGGGSVGLRAEFLRLSDLVAIIERLERDADDLRKLLSVELTEDLYLIVDSVRRNIAAFMNEVRSSLYR